MMVMLGLCPSQGRASTAGDPDPDDAEEAKPAVEAQPDPRPESQITLSPLVRRILEDDLTSQQRRTNLRLFHGQWDDLAAEEKLNPAQQARLALLQWRLNAPLLKADHDQTPALIRANAALRRGEPERVATLLDDDGSIQALTLRGQALEQRGKPGDAVEQYTRVRKRVEQEGRLEAKPRQITAAAQSLAALARLEGRPVGDYHRIMGWLGRIYSQVDPLYWPARVTEAKLLIDKANKKQALEALVEALRLNPRASRAWYQLARISIEAYDFDRAEAAINKLRRINQTHLLADLAEVRMFLKQKDVASARRVLKHAKQRYPTNRQVLALDVATYALANDQSGVNAALSRFNHAAPGSPLAHYTAGKLLSDARQYPRSRKMLKTAIERGPNWAQPRLALGLLLMQQGKPRAALKALENAHRLDRFHSRVNNQLTLVRDMLDYDTIETEHFTIRYKPGIDQVWARDVSRRVEQLYDSHTDYFEHKPKRNTQIDLMPSMEHFAVRITGRADIWTIAACTGDVVAMTPPRSGKDQHGTYDWHNVLSHEYTHAITLSQTKNRLPRWLTEACARRMETTGRTWQNYQVLSKAVIDDALFSLDELNWRFIRPKKRGDQGKAYAQSGWMVEYLVRTFGHQALIDLIEQYDNPTIQDATAIGRATGESADVFMDGFRRWAGRQVKDWGMNPPVVDDPRFKAVVTGEIETPSPQLIDDLLAKAPRHPTLLRIKAEQALQGMDLAKARRAVRAYSRARPVDPWAYRQLFQLATRIDTATAKQSAIGALQSLDRQETNTGKFAYQLAKLHRRAGRLSAAQDAIRRALDREAYNGTYRTLAATLAVQREDLTLARFHLKSLTILEPKRAVHYIRLAAINAKLGNSDAADAAARQARRIDHEADVDRFIQD